MNWAKLAVVRENPSSTFQPVAWSEVKTEIDIYLHREQRERERKVEGRKNSGSLTLVALDF
jgi:hypothetical protein